MLRIGIDTGGTFTDFVVLDGDRFTTFKLASTPDKPEAAFIEGLAQIIEGHAEFLIQHGSTVATNTLLERKGAQTLLVTNQGFEDILEIGRQNRPELYSLDASRPEPLVPPRFRVGIKERASYDGQQLVPLEQSSLDWLFRKVEKLSPEAVAVVLLYSYIRPESENRIADRLSSTGIPISLSSRVHPEFREYERTSATVINAYLTPSMNSYLSALDSHKQVQQGRLTIMQSNGGTISARAAAEYPIRTLFSGPAGGVKGAFELAQAAGYDQVITLDMGGTSTDVSLCDGKITYTNESLIDHQPVPIPMIGIHTIGAGGGSIAWVDSGGLLRVGPESAGADPGPVCYGKGKEPTVTDANLLLGILDPDWFLGGDFTVYPEKVRPSMERLGAKLKAADGDDWQPEELAQGIRRIVSTQLEGAVRVISLEKGHDTRDFTLVAFGGAAGLHACDLARSLLFPRIMIPANPGVMSAIGIQRADVVKDDAQTVLLDSQDGNLEATLKEMFQRLEGRVLDQLQSEGFSNNDVKLEFTLDVRYRGQSYELNVPFGKDYAGEFHRRHQKHYGHSSPGLPVEIVTLRVSGTGKVESLGFPRHPLESETPVPEALVQEKQLSFEGGPIATRFYPRKRLRPGNRIKGPAVIVEYSSTTFIPPDFQVHVDEFLNLIIEPV